LKRYKVRYLNEYFVLFSRYSDFPEYLEELYNLNKYNEFLEETIETNKRILSKTNRNIKR